MKSSRTESTAPRCLLVIKAKWKQDLVSACVKQTDWPESLHCVHLDTCYQSRQKVIHRFQNKLSMKYLLTYQLLLILHRQEFLNLTTTGLTGYVLNTNCTVCGTSSMQSVTIDLAAVPTPNWLQRTACIHLNLLMHWALCCQWKIPLQIPSHCQELQGPDREPRQPELTSYQHDMAHMVKTTQKY